MDVQPFANDIEFLEAEGECLLARTRRMTIERRLAEVCGHIGQTGYRRRSRARVADNDEWATAVATEQRLRQTVDARVEATKAAGIALGIDTLTREPMTQIERTCVLLAGLSAADTKYEQAIAGVTESPFVTHPTLEVVVDYLELPFAERIAARGQFSPVGQLIRDGAIIMEPNRKAIAAALRGTDCLITEWAFQKLFGLDDIPKLGQDEIDPDGV